jgi:hypothetical protein
MSRFFSIPEAPAYFHASILYERKPVTDLWNRLTAVAKQQWKWRAVANKEDPTFRPSQRRILQVQGPPGTGKSSATYRWVRSVCETARPNNRGVQALWIDCARASETETNCWTISQDTGQGRVTVTPTALPTGSADAVFADIVVLDGIQIVTVERWGDS